MTQFIFAPMTAAILSLWSVTGGLSDIGEARRMTVVTEELDRDGRVLTLIITETPGTSKDCLSVDRFVRVEGRTRTTMICAEPGR
jgi:hypothetical protein